MHHRTLLWSLLGLATTPGVASAEPATHTGGSIAGFAYRGTGSTPGLPPRGETFRAYHGVAIEATWWPIVRTERSGGFSWSRQREHAPWGGEGIFLASAISLERQGDCDGDHAACHSPFGSPPADHAVFAQRIRTGIEGENRGVQLGVLSWAAGEQRRRAALPDVSIRIGPVDEHLVIGFGAASPTSLARPGFYGGASGEMWSNNELHARIGAFAFGSTWRPRADLDYRWGSGSTQLQLGISGLTPFELRLGYLVSL